MVDYREILRLKSLGNSQRQIEKMVHSGHHTVSDTLAAAREKGIAWPLDESMTNESFKRFCSLASSSNARSTLNRIMPTSIGNWLNRASPWHYSGNKKFFSVNEAKANDCVIDQYADGICMMKYKGRRVYACFPSLATSFKARPDRFNDPILLLGSHFVVAGEAEAAVEDVPADGLGAAGDIGVGLGAQAAAATDEGVQAVHRLLGHGLHSFVRMISTIYSCFAVISIQYIVIPDVYNHIGHFPLSKHDTTSEVIKKTLAGFREFCFTRNPARVELTGCYRFRMWIATLSLLNPPLRCGEED